MREVSIRRAVFVRADLGSPGTAVFAGIEHPPVLVNAARWRRPRSAPAPRGGGLGSEPAFDGAAVLEAHLRRQAVRYDVYLNVAAACGSRSRGRLAAAAAWCRRWSMRRCARCVYFGELSLSGAPGRWRKPRPPQKRQNSDSPAVLPNRRAVTSAGDAGLVLIRGRITSLVADIARGTPEETGRKTRTGAAVEKMPHLRDSGVRRASGVTLPALAAINPAQAEMTHGSRSCGHALSPSLGTARHADSRFGLTSGPD